MLIICFAQLDFIQTQKAKQCKQLNLAFPGSELKAGVNMNRREI